MSANPADVASLVTRPVTAYPTSKISGLLHGPTPPEFDVCTHQRYDCPRVRAGGDDPMDGPNEQVEPDEGQMLDEYEASNTWVPANVSIHKWYEVAELTLLQL